MKTLYTAHATTVAGREGHSKTDDGTLDLQLSPPGSGKPGTNPEQLFAVGYGACFGGAVGLVAKKQGVTPSEVKVSASVDLRQADDGFSIAVELDVALAGIDDETAASIVKTAHTVCPYSKATRGNIDVTLKVNGTAI